MSGLLPSATQEPADSTGVNMPTPGAGPRKFLPSRSTRDVLWLLVVSAFVLVLLASVGVMSAFVFIFPMSQTPQVLLILFTAAAGFLGGLFAPSPFGVNQANSTAEEGANMPG
jgi:fatty acid desaturase